jgi:hypothetical protein
MSRFATAIDLHTWKTRHTGRKPKKGRKARRKGYTSAGSMAGEETHRDRDRDRDRERNREPDAEYEDPDEGQLEGWDGDLDADLDADQSDRMSVEDLGDDEPFEDDDRHHDDRHPDRHRDDRHHDQEDDVGLFGRRRRRREAATAANEPRRAGPLVKLRSAGGRTWAPPVELGTNMQVRARRGFRAAVVEIKPGLFVIAEVPQTSVEFGFGPLLLGPALMKTLSRAFGRSQAGEGAGDGAQRPELSQQPAPRQLTGPTTAAPDPRLPQWVDGEVAAELGCGPYKKRERA